MRSLVGIGLLSAGVLMSPAPRPRSRGRQDVEALRQELEQMRRQFETMREGYEKAIDRLGERIQQLESKPQPAGGRAGARARPGGRPGPRAGRPAIAVTPLDLARPRQPFALYSSAGPASSCSTWASPATSSATSPSATSTRPTPARSGTARTASSRARSSSPCSARSIPTRAPRCASRRARRTRARSRCTSPRRTSPCMTLPFDTQLKMGQMRNRFGLLNQIHEHDRPFIDAPNVLARFLGEEGLVESGAELTWVAPLPFYLEVLVGVFNGDNEVAFGRGKLNEPLADRPAPHVLRAGRLGRHPARRLGGHRRDPRAAPQHPASASTPSTSTRPEGWQHPLLTLLGELIYQERRVNELGEDTDGDGIHDTPDETRTAQPAGLVRGRRGAAVPHRVAEGLGAGFRYDWTQYPIMRGREWAVGPYLTYCRRSSCASGSATSTPSGPPTAQLQRQRIAAPGRWTRSSSRPPSSWAPTRRIRSEEASRPCAARSAPH